MEDCILRISSSTLSVRLCRVVLLPPSPKRCLYACRLVLQLSGVRWHYGDIDIDFCEGGGVCLCSTLVRSVLLTPIPVSSTTTLMTALHASGGRTSPNLCAPCWLSSEVLGCVYTVSCSGTHVRMNATFR